VSVLTLVALVAIFVGVTGVEIPLPRLGGQTSDRPLPGVRAAASSILLRVGSTAPAGGELAFLAVEPAGNLVITDARRRVVMRFDPSGHLLSEWGPRLGATTLEEPAGVAVHGDSFYVVDRAIPPRIIRLDASGQLQATLALEQFGTYGLNGLTVDPTGNLYVADTGRNRILVFSPAGALLRTIGRPGTDLGGLTQPMMADFGPDGSLFIADWENGRVASWNAALDPLDAWPTGFRPFGVAVDQIGRVYVPDAEKRRVLAYTPRGAVLGEFGGPGSPPIEIAPKQVAVGGGARPSLYLLGSAGLQRLDLENTAAPPQATADVDYVSWLVIVFLGAVLVFAVLSRRATRSAALLGPPPDREIRLDAKNGAAGQYEQAHGDQELLIANQPKREQ
jgi:sugar lactone lactonase YvrE